MRPVSNMVKVPVFLLVLALALAHGKQFERCDFARRLKAAGMDGYRNVSLANWVCLTRWESNFNTEAINYNTDKSTDYGIFQINNRFWCDDGKFKTHNICKVSCSALMADDISNAVQCAKTIVTQQGITAWVGWRAHCKDQDVSSYIKDCGLEKEFTYIKNKDKNEIL